MKAAAAVHEHDNLESRATVGNIRSATLII